MHEDHTQSTPLTKFLATMLAEGRQKLAAKAAAAKAADEQREAERRAEWAAMWAACRGVVGDLLPADAADPPANFGVAEGAVHGWPVHLRPFGAGTITLKMKRLPVNSPAPPAVAWFLGRAEERNNGNGLYRVPSDYECCEDSGPRARVVECGPVAYVDDLAEAVALCWEATESWRAAEEERVRWESPVSQGA